MGGTVLRPHTYQPLAIVAWVHDAYFSVYAHLALLADAEVVLKTWISASFGAELQCTVHIEAVAEGNPKNRRPLRLAAHHLALFELTYVDNQSNRRKLKLKLATCA